MDDDYPNDLQDAPETGDVEKTEPLTVAEEQPAESDAAKTESGAENSGFKKIPAFQPKPHEPVESVSLPPVDPEQAGRAGFFGNEGDDLCSPEDLTQDPVQGMRGSMPGALNSRSEDDKDNKTLLKVLLIVLAVILLMLCCVGSGFVFLLKEIFF